MAILYLHAVLAEIVNAQTIPIY